MSSCREELEGLVAHEQESIRFIGCAIGVLLDTLGRPPRSIVIVGLLCGEPDYEGWSPDGTQFLLIHQGLALRILPPSVAMQEYTEDGHLDVVEALQNAQHWGAEVSFVIIGENNGRYCVGALTTKVHAQA